MNDTGGETIQNETSRQLEEVINLYATQRVPVDVAFLSLMTILNKNPTLTEEQFTEGYNLYREELEQVLAAAEQAHAISQGKRELGTPLENANEPNLNLLFGLKPNSEQQGGSLKRISEEESPDRGEYAWNWKKPGGGPPWRDVDEKLLSDADKTHLLRNAYTTNINRALQSLERQRNIPDFPPFLWRDVLSNRQVEFGALLEDRYSIFTTYENTIDLGNGVELRIPRANESKYKISNHAQWMYAWMKYREAVCWAFPHRKDELETYEEHITGRFDPDLNPIPTIEYDQAARKYFHAHQHFSFAQTNHL